MAEEHSVLSDDYVDRTRELLDRMESGAEDDAARILDELTKLRENSLFKDLGRLTREFHEALNNFRLDSRISSLAQSEIPDARERLKYVITMTNQAAERTLTAVEESVPICERIESRSSAIGERWQRFVTREMNAAEFRELSRDLTEYLNGTGEELPKLRANLQDVLMAQDFQDLTGQIITRVITMVEDLEKSLVELIRISGQNLIPEGKNEHKESTAPSGPPVPGVDSGTVSGQDEVDELLSSLGF